MIFKSSVFLPGNPGDYQEKNLLISGLRVCGRFSKCGIKSKQKKQLPKLFLRSEHAIREKGLLLNGTFQDMDFIPV